MLRRIWSYFTLADYNRAKEEHIGLGIMTHADLKRQSREADKATAKLTPSQRFDLAMKERDEALSSGYLLKRILIPFVYAHEST